MRAVSAIRKARQLSWHMRRDSHSMRKEGRYAHSHALYRCVYTYWYPLYIHIYGHSRTLYIQPIVVIFVKRFAQFAEGGQARTHILTPYTDLYIHYDTLYIFVYTDILALYQYIANCCDICEEVRAVCGRRTGTYAHSDTLYISICTDVLALYIYSPLSWNLLRGLHSMREEGRYERTSRLALHIHTYEHSCTLYTSLCGRRTGMFCFDTRYLDTLHISKYLDILSRSLLICIWGGYDE